MLAAALYASFLGLGLLLSGMKLMERSLGLWAGERLAGWLSRATSTPVRGFLVGTAASALLQSSSAVTVLTIGFVNAGLIPMSRSLGILLGTNVGTCLTTELMSLQIHRYGFPLLAISAGGWLLTAICGEMKLLPPLPLKLGRSLRYGAAALSGFAVLLIGFRLLLSTGAYAEKSGWFGMLLTHAENHPLSGLLVSAALTAFIHSSAAVIAMAMGLAGAGSLSPQAGVAVVLGANVGTCFTGLLASLGGSRGGRFVALSQLGLNVGGALLFIPFMGVLQAVAQWLAPGDPAAQIAHAQTVFNVACSLIALPLAYDGTHRMLRGFGHRRR